MKSPITLWTQVAYDYAARCECTSATRDSETVSSRFEHEGWSFLTITLPSYGKDFEKSLDRGFVDHDLFHGFKWKGGLPVFLRGFLDRVFDPVCGVLLDSPDHNAIRAVRQLTLMFGKVNLPCSERRTRDAFDQFIQCEKELRESDERFDSHVKTFFSDHADFTKSQFTRISSLLFRSLFQRVDYDVATGNVVPKHGPGATAEKLSSNRKYRQPTWTTRLERVFPSREYLVPSERFFETLDRIQFLEPGDEMPVRVISVPKTLKTPRIIAIEPACMQYTQQGLLESIRNHLEGSYLYGFIGFDDQEPNQLLAQRGSSDGTLATLDLSEASDRVSNQHVRAMLEPFPWFFRGVDSCRSRKADVPGHGVVRLAKFASMGSALTFPMEAMVFLTIIFCGIERDLSTLLTKKSQIMSFLGQVRVYGDDIIIPVDHVQSVLDSLAAFGYKVNENKSFWTGKFRESCGREFYDGSDVSIVRVREVFPENIQHVRQVVSSVSLRNLLYEQRLWASVIYMDSWLKPLLKGKYPIVHKTSDVLGRYSFLDYISQEKYDEDLHVPLVKGWTLRTRTRPDFLDDYGALLKYFLRRGVEPSFDEHHLRRAGRPLDVSIKLGWSKPF